MANTRDGRSAPTGSNGSGRASEPPTVEVLAPGTMDYRTRSEIAEQIRIAREFPRDVKAALALASDLALSDDETAASCYYTLARRDRETGEDKPIEGPSVRLAEIIVMAWGHLFVGAGQSGLTDRFVTSRGAVWDMQTNNRWMFETTRRITKRNGQTYSDDMIATTANAAASIALRNGVFKVVPSPFWRPIYLKCRELSMGTEQDLQKNWTKALRYFETELKVTEAHVLAWLRIRSVKEVQRVHVGRLRGLATAIKDGEQTLEEAFADLEIVAMPQRESAAAAAPAAEPPAEPKPDPRPVGLVITRLRKKETTAAPDKPARPYWVVEFSSGQQAITFSTTQGAQLEAWALAETSLDDLQTHQTGQWTYLDGVKAAAVPA